MITREKFIEATGREPEQDDLERCNCPFAGAIIHQCCGWNEALDKPQFDVGPRYIEAVNAKWLQSLAEGAAA